MKYKNFDIVKTDYGWELHITRMGEDKDGNPKEQVDKLYYGKLDHVLGKIIDLEAGECPDIESLRELMSGGLDVMLSKIEVKNER